MIKKKKNMVLLAGLGLVVAWLFRCGLYPGSNSCAPWCGLTDKRFAVAVRDPGFFFFQAEDGIRDYKVTGVQDVCSSDLQYLLGILPIEPHPGCARRNLLGLHEGRERAGYGAQKTGLLQALVLFLGLLSGLDFAPDAFHIARRLGRSVAEYVGMAAHQFPVDGVERVADREAVLFGGHLGIEDRLEQEVAQLFREALPVAPVDGIEDLIGLFEGVGLDGIEGLLAIPGASTGRPQLGHQLHQFLKFLSSRGMVFHGRRVISPNVTWCSAGPDASRRRRQDRQCPGCLS